MAHTTENTTGYQAYTATAVAIGLGIRVKLDSNGLISAAGADESSIGVAAHPIAASGKGTVKLWSAPGTFMVVAGGAVEVGDILYAAASGKVNDVQAAGGSTGLQAKDAAGADGDIIEAVKVAGTSAGGAVTTIDFPITLANITGTGDVVTAYPLTFSGTITAVNFVVTTAVTTAAKLATLNVEIGTTNLTGGVVALTSANCTPLGVVVPGSAVTAANTFVAGDTLSVESSAVTAFVEGAGILKITVVQN